MEKELPHGKKNAFEHFASIATRASGSTAAFIMALLTILVWLVTGPLFDYSDTWQLAINTFTTITTFLMVFLIQKTQNKDTMVMQIKLNELLAASELASNRIVSIEDLTEEELTVLHKYYSELALMAKNEGDLQTSHSIDEAKSKHHIKRRKSQLNTEMRSRKGDMNQ